VTGRLFIALFLDEDVPVLIARLVRARGYNAVTALGTTRLGLEDAEQLAYAVGEGYAVLTHNRQHLALLHEEWLLAGRHHSGIIAAFHGPPGEVANRLLALLDRVTDGEMRDQLPHL
jgi:hypothetical protein